eukprot:6182661-Pleurochrysis_carterae.AAC.3
MEVGFGLHWITCGALWVVLEGKLAESTLNLIGACCSAHAKHPIVAGLDAHGGQLAGGLLSGLAARNGVEGNASRRGGAAH